MSHTKTCPLNWPFLQLALPDRACHYHRLVAKLEWTVQVKEESVAELHAQYYAEVEKLYSKHSQTFPGYKDMRLVMF